MLLESTVGVVGKAILSAVVGAIVGGIIGIFREQIENRFRQTKDNYLRGSWDCTWLIASPTTVSTNPIRDQVEITQVNGQLVKGEGSTLKFGRSHFHGKTTQFVITLSYAGEKASKDLVGMVMLKKDSPTKLNGVWCQYGSDGTLMSGTTVWEKIA